MLSSTDIERMLAFALARVNPDVHRILAAQLARIYGPRNELNCFQWAEAHLYIPPEESPERFGPYDSAEVPAIRRMMEFITNPLERVFIIRKSSQLGFTLAYLIIILFLAVTRPANVLYAMDSAKEAKNISLRLRRLIAANPLLAGILTDEGEDDLMNLLLKLRGMLVWLIGSGAEGGFANKTAGLVILDELDLYELLSRKGHDMFHRALERIKDVEAGKFIAGGKPEEYDFPTNKNFRHGTREELFLPCPHCDHFQPIHLEGMRFDHCKDLAGHWDFPKVIAETFYECEFCHRPIKQEHKPAMLRRYRCVAMNRGQDDDKPIPGWVSLWVNDFYSSRPQHSWGHLMQQFITAKASPAAMRVFFNGALALPKQEKKTEISKSDLHKLNGGYEHGCMPKRPAINPATGAAAIVLCADNQGSGEKKWVKVGILPDGEAFVIDYGRCLTFHALNVLADEPVWIGLTAPPQKDLDAIREEALSTSRDYFTLLRERLPDREFHTASVGFIDEGHDTFVVRDFCHSTGDSATNTPPRFFPCKGIARANAVELVHEIADKFRTTKTDDGPFITVYHYSDDDLKRELYIGRIGGFDEIKSGKSTVPRLWFPAYCEEEFLDELCQEKRALVMHKGKPTWMWIDPKNPNDWGDALKECFACWQIIKGKFPAPAAEAAAA